MPGLVPAIHAFGVAARTTWMAGTKPGHEKNQESPKRRNEGETSMKRAVVFLVLGPASVFLAWSIFVAGAGGPAGGFVAFVGMLLFLFTLPVAALSASFDGYLARALPLPLRAPSTAIVGATIAGGLACALFSCLFPPSMLMWFAIGGAVCMGACSLLSHDYGNPQRRAARRAGLPSNAG
jgi:hypothetical protein